jgi:CheY-like chemotaxis protein
MPLLDGYKTCAAIRETGNALPVVAMTAYVMDAEKEKCNEAGMNDYLAKPLDEAELKKVLVKYLDAFINPTEKEGKVNSTPFLLELAGGDKQMAEIIFNHVKQEIPLEIAKLNKIISEKNMAALPAVCHYLISSISPLGNNSPAMQKITALQKMISDKETEKAIFKITAELIDELENTHNNFKQA